MFSPMFHGQNRSTILNPIGVPNNGFIWLNHDSFNVSLANEEIIRYKDVVDAEIHLTVDNGTYYYPRYLTEPASLPIPSNLFNGYPYGDYYGFEDPNNPAELFDIESNWDTNNIIETITPLYRDSTFFTVVTLRTSHLSSSGGGNAIWSWSTQTNGECLSLCFKEIEKSFPADDEIGLRISKSNNTSNYQEVLGEVSIGTLDATLSDFRTFIIASTTREVWVNGVKVLDITPNFNLTTSTQMQSEYVFCGSHQRSYSTGVFNTGYIAELLMYGYKLSDHDIKGVCDYLNEKYKIY